MSAGSVEPLEQLAFTFDAAASRPAEAPLAAPAGRPSPTQLKVLPGTSWRDIFEDAA